MALQVLLVEDEPGDLRDYEAAFPRIFEQNQVEVKLHPCGNFQKAFKLASDPLLRFDLIISDTYQGSTKNAEAEVLKMVKVYRGSRFCPLVIYSSGVKPADLQESAFVVWADKAKGNEDIERAITTVLRTRVPQISRALHEELENSAASFLWQFLEKNWAAISKAEESDSSILERLIRRRAAIQIGDLERNGQDFVPVLHRGGSEYYVYPKIARNYYSLGDILRHKQHQNDFRVVLTPHCYLFKQPGQQRPRADFVLTVKTITAAQALGDKSANAKTPPQKAEKHKKLEEWTRSPAQTGGKPAGRHWFLPGFLDIPYLYCDLLQIESLAYDEVVAEYEAIATLVAPYAEALQACFSSFYGSVGIPNLQLASIENMLG